ncbi:MAG: type II toxin-antitoxin system VapC family toxin [Caldilineaceae bacterium]
MRILLDTHTFLWWTENSPKLSTTAHAAMTNGKNQLFLSVVSAWEIAIKAQLGKLAVSGDLSNFITEQIYLNRISVLPIHLQHALEVASLPLLHRDPFDRLLIAQSRQERIPILTLDPLISQYEVETLW